MVNKPAKKILFYSNVSNIDYFKTQSFYVNDIYCLESCGFEVKKTNKLYSFLFFWTYDISFCYFYRKSFIAGLISKLFFKKLYYTGGVDHLALPETSKAYWLQKILLNFCYFFADRFFVVSTSDLKNIKKALFFKFYKKLTLSFHSIDIDSNTLPSIYSQSLANPRSDFVTISWMGSVQNVKRKGVDKAIIFFYEYCKFFNDKDSKLYIIGARGEGTDYLLSLILDFKIENRVEFCSSISDDLKFQFLKSCKYYLQFSTYEGFGVAALEALAHGCYVLHSGNGGLKDTVSDFGLVVDINKSDFTHTFHLLEHFNYSEYSKKFPILNKSLESFTHKKRSEVFSKFIY